MNILILTGKFGMGHLSVSKALEEEFKVINKNINVNIVDLIEYVYPNRAELIYKSFSQVVNICPELYNLMYKASEKVEVDMRLPGNSINKKMKNLIDLYSPDIIISTIPMCSRTISAYKAVSNIDIPLVTCVTDISMHIEWVAPKTDYYLVPTLEIKYNLIKNGINGKNIFVVGIPVKQSFKNIRHKESSSNKKNILIMGGGLGLIPNLDEMMNELAKIPNLSITIITGKNKRSYLQFLDKYKNAEIIGFTNEVDKYLSKADIIITKPGGVTLFESIFSETPMFVIKPFLAQEKSNAKYIEANSIGKILWRDREDTTKSLCEFIYDEENLNAMKENMREIKVHTLNSNLTNVLKYLMNEAKYEVNPNYNMSIVI
ncbi:UDP-N-acetylglucosamine:LPS N-acetylglucosamine transferase [Anaerosphaera aminiphila DSM 21120]|uniref:UDP-N-acetylglucosamine:LPS N-acetylglucosamine transferase n=1 Tax=Anaerosphaera aminiphila DSM 21120 TaxID=1120995 RepID=A0A1M5UQ11_9FIRM|nr:glycosyltransferase [Anaerosphaera aminiphila]SHH65014.1 UDP-N-acetylglucosamine:LPS N-acetylglucosamine transferase [Anaerosphaera aminiphila DSM 21120]